MTESRQTEIRELVEASLKSLDAALKKTNRFSEEQTTFYFYLARAYSAVEATLADLDDIPIRSIPSPEDWGPEERKAA